MNFQQIIIRDPDILEDIKTQSDWIVKAFGADKLKLDHSLESFKLIDKFIDRHSKNGKANPKGRLAQNLGPILFSLGAYVGETILRNVPGAVWITNDADPEGELNVEVLLPDGTACWPVQRMMKRFKNGDIDSIYPYGAVVIKEIGKTGAREPVGTIKARARKPWWRF